MRHLDGSVQQALAQLAVVPTGLAHWLVEALVPEGVATLAAAEQRGLLTVSPERVAFRHELTRRAIADALPGARRVELNRRVLAALVGAQWAMPNPQSSTAQTVAAAFDRLKLPPPRCPVTCDTLTGLEVLVAGSVPRILERTPIDPWPGDAGRGRAIIAGTKARVTASRPNTFVSN